MQSGTTELMRNVTETGVLGAVGTPGRPFSVQGRNVPLPCRAFPRVDAYLYPPVLYKGTTQALSTLLPPIGRFTGDCPTEATVEYDWVHVRLGSLPAGS